MSGNAALGTNLTEPNSVSKAVLSTTSSTWRGANAVPATIFSMERICIYPFHKSALRNRALFQRGEVGHSSVAPATRNNDHVEHSSSSLLCQVLRCLPQKLHFDDQTIIVMCFWANWHPRSFEPSWNSVARTLCFNTLFENIGATPTRCFSSQAKLPHHHFAELTFATTSTKRTRPASERSLQDSLFSARDHVPLTICWMMELSVTFKFVAFWVDSDRNKIEQTLWQHKRAQSQNCEILCFQATAIPVKILQNIYIAFTGLVRAISVQKMIHLEMK